MPAALLCLVIAITDGDTIKVRCGEPGSYVQERVRLAEIDAPEKRQPFGQRSRQHLAELCAGQMATIRQTAYDSRWHRPVARVECKGQDVNSEQVRAGMAWAYTKYLTDPEIKRLETEARAAGRGLWADSASVPPWEWRKKPRN